MRKTFRGRLQGDTTRMSAWERRAGAIATESEHEKYSADTAGESTAIKSPK